MLSPFGKIVWEDRYALKDENGKLIEKNILETFRRVATAIASKEKDSEYWGNKFYNIMADQSFCPAGRVLAHSGTHYSQLLNCFVLPFQDDSLEEIMNTSKNMAVVQKFGGGTGFNFSKLRPSGSYIKGVNGRSCGTIGFTSMMSTISEIIEQGGTRRGANLGLLEAWHPDIWEFISYKTEHNWECLQEFIDVNDNDKWESFKYENLYKWQMFNVSVGITDEFLEAVENNWNWKLKWKEEEWLLYTVLFKKSLGNDEYKELKCEVTANCDETAIWKVKKKIPYPTGSDIFEVVSKRKVKASEIWDRICYNAWADGCPGIINLTTARKMHNLEYIYPINASNPCAEQLLGEFSSCNLSSILLSNFIIEETKTIDWNKLKEVIHTAVRFSDNVIDNCEFPIPEIKEKAYQERRIGLGTMGVHDMLIKMELGYDSDEGRDLVEKVLIFIRNEAYRASIELSNEKGSFPAYDKKKYLKNGFIKTLPHDIIKDIEKHGIRDSCLLSQAPTGSISALNNVSSGCEPWYSLSFQRNTRLGSYEDGCPTYIEWQKKNPDSPIPSYFKTAPEIAPEDHVKMLILFSKYIDSAVSKCVAKGTMIVTSNGIVPIESMSDFKYNKSDVFSEPNKDYSVLDENGRLIKVSRHYYGGKKSCLTVRFKNGFKLTTAKTHLLKTVEGWKSVGKLKESDIILYRLDKMTLCEKDLISVKKKPNFYNHIERDFPSQFTEEFAEFLGAWLADGSCNVNSMSICKKDDIVIKRLIYLFKILFGVEVEPYIDKRNGVKNLVINSRALVKYFKENYGSNALNKRVPQEIMLSSHNVQKAFIKGLSMDGYIRGDREGFIIYEGYSKQIVESVSYILSSLGVRYYIGDKKVKEGKLSKKAFSIVAYPLEKGVINPIEPHKKIYKINSSDQWQIYVSDEIKERYMTLPSTKSENYFSFRNLRKSLKKKSSVRKSLLKKLDVPVDYNLLCLEISDIEDGGIQEVYEIEVEGTHSYLINGIVSHNTVNLPNSATVDIIKETFIYAMENGVKGLTVFRDGSKEGVLVNKDKKKEIEKVIPVMEEKDRFENVMSPKKRGSKTVGSTYRVHMQNHNLYVTVNRNKDGELVELFTTVGESRKPNVHHTSGVEDSWAEGLGKMISLALRAGVKPASIIRNLKNIPSDKPVFATIGDGESSEHVPSPPHAIARVIEEELMEGEENHSEGNHCVECGSTNTKQKSPTCYECFDCGFVACG